MLALSQSAVIVHCKLRSHTIHCVQQVSGHQDLHYHTTGVFHMSVVITPADTHPV